MMTAHQPSSRVLTDPAGLRELALVLHDQGEGATSIPLDFGNRPVRIEVIRDETTATARFDGAVTAKTEGLERTASGGVGFKLAPEIALRLSETRLEGELDPKWLDAAAAEQARREAAKLLDGR